MRFPLYKRKHEHRMIIQWTQEEVWLECSCGLQEDIPDGRLDEAYDGIRRGDLLWKTQPNSITKS